MKKILFTVMSVLILLSCENKHPQGVIKTNQPIVKDTIDEYIDLIAVGDIMIGTSFPDASLLAPDSGRKIFNNVKHILDDADITIGNLEGCIMDGGTPKKKCVPPNKCFIFRMPVLSAEIFKNAGFDFMNIANNHIGDFGEEGIASTINALESVGIKFSGISKYPYQIIEVKGKKISFAGFSNNQYTLKMNDYENCRKIVKEMKSKSDIAVISFHGGGEGVDYRHITKDYEMFLGSNRGNPYKFARLMIDAGADLIIGHSPHLTRAVDIYKNKLIAYSLGNFATYRKFNISGSCGYAPIIKVKLNKDGDFVSAEVTSIVQRNSGIPFIDTLNRAYKEIISLTKEDIGETELVFENGKISRKVLK